MRLLPLFAFFTATFLLTTVSSGQTITIEKWGERKEQRFDPAHPPANLPMLAKNEMARAEARPWVQWTANASRGLWDPRAHTLTIDAVGDVTFSGHTDLLLPYGATPSLQAHEIGHDRLNAAEWDRSAKQLVTDALKGFNGLKFTGEGPDDAARRASGWKKADAEHDRRMGEAVAGIQKRLDAVGDRFDVVTDHGRSETVDSDRGVAAVLKEPPTAGRAATRPRP